MQGGHRNENKILNEGIYMELIPNNKYYKLYNTMVFKYKNRKNGTEKQVQLFCAVANKLDEQIKINGKFGKILYEENKNYKYLDRCKYPTLYKFNKMFVQYNNNHDEIYYYNNDYNVEEWDYFINMYITKRWHISDVWWRCVDHPEIYEYLEIREFKEAIMINVSPDWKGKCNNQQIDILKKVVEVIGGNKNRFENYAYAIECGSNGDFVHMHCVLAFNDQQINNYKKHKNYCKAGIYKEFQTAFKRSAEVIHKSYSELNLMIDKKLIRSQDMLGDKLDYLIESRKPMSHQNKPHKLFPIYFNSWEN